MKPFMIVAQCHTGDADGPNNMDLLVTAAGVTQARALWRQHFDGWDMPDTIDMYSLPTGWPNVEGVLAWADLPMIRMPA